MSVQVALAFIKEVRRDGALQRAIQADLRQYPDCRGLVAVAAEAGFVFTEDDLQRAHKYDWAMRLARLSHRPSDAAGGAR